MRGSWMLIIDRRWPKWPGYTQLVLQATKLNRRKQSHYSYTSIPGLFHSFDYESCLFISKKCIYTSFRFILPNATGIPSRDRSHIPLTIASTFEEVDAFPNFRCGLGIWMHCSLWIFLIWKQLLGKSRWWLGRLNSDGAPGKLSIGSPSDFCSGNSAGWDLRKAFGAYGFLHFSPFSTIFLEQLQINRSYSYSVWQCDKKIISCWADALASKHGSFPCVWVWMRVKSVTFRYLSSHVFSISLFEAFYKQVWSVCI